MKLRHAAAFAALVFASLAAVPIVKIVKLIRETKEPQIRPASFEDWINAFLFDLVFLSVVTIALIISIACCLFYGQPN